jgi:hypothetical protein
VLIGLSLTASALADAPAVKITKADQARAVANLLRRSDLGIGWLGGAVKPMALTPPNCPGFAPKESDLTVSGHADARFTFSQAGLELDQDVQVLDSADSVRTDFARTVSPKLAGCLALQLRQLPNVVSAEVEQIPFPPTGSVSAVFRATVVVHNGKAQGTLLSDYVFLGSGRMECEFTVIAPVGARDQLVRFEQGLAQILLRRAAAA